MSDPSGSVHKQIKYEDYVGPNPFIRPWMLPYLPRDPRLRDFIVMVAGGSVCLVVGILLGKATSSEFLGVIVSLGGAGYFLYDAMWRHLLASMRYGRAKQNAGK